jgi:predicted site-specific integrase-resolvase
MKAEAARRVLAEEDPNDIAADLGVSRSSVMNWAKEAKLRAFAETSKKFEANDIQKVSAELAEALNLQRAATERVKVLKARLRELLGDE